MTERKHPGELELRAEQTHRRDRINSLLMARNSYLACGDGDGANRCTDKISDEARRVEAIDRILKARRERTP